MHRTICPALILALLSGCASGNSKPQAFTLAPTPLWTLSDGLSNPESAYLDPGTGHLFLSNVSGDSAAKDGVGFISKLTPDGKMISAQWVAGLNAPKGIRTHKGTLYVSDLTEVVAIDIKTARIRQRIPCPDAGFVNDVAAGPDGTIYASDMLKSRVYAIKDGVASVFAEGPQLEWPNGLLVDGNRLICGGWGKPRGDTSTAIGHLYALDLKTKQKTFITPQPLGNLDGIESDGAGGYIVSDWPNGKVFHVSKSGDATTLLSATRGTADLAYLRDKRILLLPRMPESKLEAYQLKKQ